MRLVILLSFSSILYGAVTYTGSLGTNQSTRAAACEAAEACIITVTGTGTYPNKVGVVADIQTAVNSACYGDTIKKEAGTSWSSSALNAVYLHPQKCGNSALETIITTTEDAKLPNPGTRITMAYLPLLPRVRVTGGTGPFYYVPNSHEGVAEDRTPGQAAKKWVFRGLANFIATDFSSGASITRGVISVGGSSAIRATTSLALSTIVVTSGVGVATFAYTGHGYANGSAITFRDSAEPTLNGDKTVTSSTSTAVTFSAPGVPNLSYNAATDYGPGVYVERDITTVAVASGIATITHKTAHGLLENDVIGLRGTDITGLDGVFTVRPSPTTLAFEIATPGVPDGDYTTSHVYWESPPSLTYAPSDITLDRIIVSQETWQGIVRRSIGSINGTRITVRDSFIEGTQDNGADSQTIYALFGLNQVIRNNYIGPAAENIMFGGSTSSLAPEPATNPLVELNYLTHQPERYWTINWSLLKGTGVGKNGVVFIGRLVRPSNVSNMHLYIATNTGVIGAVEPNWSLCTTGTSNCPFIDGTVQWRRWTTTSSRTSSDWVIKNNFEIKGAIDAQIRYNVFDYMWNADQTSAINIKTDPQTKHGGSMNICTPSAWGTVTTAGTVVTRSTGTFPFMVGGVLGQTYLHNVNPAKIYIAGVEYTIASFDTATQLTLTTSAGTNASPVSMHYGAPRSRICFAEYNLRTTFEHNITRNVSRGLSMQPGQGARRDMSDGYYIRHNLFHSVDPVYWHGVDGAVYASGDARTHLTMTMAEHTEIEHNTFIGINTGSAVYIGDYWGGKNHKFRWNIFNAEGAVSRAFWTSHQESGAGGNLAEHPAMLRDICDQPAPWTSGSCSTDKWEGNVFSKFNVSSFSASPGKVWNLCTDTQPYRTGCTSANWNLLFRDGLTHPYRVLETATGAFKRAGLNGKDIGADTAKLTEIRSLVVSPVDRQVLFTWTVTEPMKDVPCVIEINTRQDFDPTTYAGELSNIATYYRYDADDHNRNPRYGYFRSIVIGHTVNLMASTRYFYRLQCGGDTRIGEFTTLANLSGTSNIRIDRSNASNVTWGYSYSRSTDAIASPTAAVCYTTYCLANGANRGSVIYYRKGATGIVMPVTVQ